MSSYPTAPLSAQAEDVQSVRRHATQVALVANLAMQGKLNAIFRDFTLTASATTTTLTDPRLTVFSAVVPIPSTKNAMEEYGTGTFYCLDANKNNGAWVWTHSNNTQTDRTFDMLIIG